MSQSELKSAPLNPNSKPPLRIAINGFGRIGRNVLRALIERFEVLGRQVHIVAINDIADADTLLHLLKYDSTHGRLSRLGVEASLEKVTKQVESSFSSKNSSFRSKKSTIDNYKDNYPGNHTYNHPNNDLSNQQISSIQLCLSKQNTTYCIDLLSESEPEQLPWKSLGVDVVLECTGHFRSYEDAYRHITAGATQVIVGAAPFDKVDASIVMGVNDNELSRDLPVISSVSCTTQALVPLIYILDKAFGTESVMMTEIHAVTADQNVLDQPHRDKRRARASGHNIIPTTSSSIAATERTLPNMLGKIDGYSIRVPTIDVAAIDVNFIFKREVTLDEIRAVIRKACEPESSLYGIMGYTNEPLVSSDFIHRAESLIVDEHQLMKVRSQVKVFAWYDNEWGYANRLLDMCLHLYNA